MKQNKEISFFLKVLRNGLILVILLFLSMWTVQEICWTMIKPLIIFFLGYIATELAYKYKLKVPNRKGQTLMF